SPSVSVHDKTMLQRVVMKRSGRRAPAGDASGFTAADHLICPIVRQAPNFPAVAGILRVPVDRSALEAVPTRNEGAGLMSDIVTKMRLWKLAQEFPDRISCGIVADAAGKLSASPAQLHSQYFRFYSRHLA